MLISVINPTISSNWDSITQKLYVSAALPGTRIQVFSLNWGTASIEGRADDALAAPGILTCAQEAEANGSSAIIIDCMNDPALYAAREIVRIPVVGPAEASMHLACMLATRFSIITTDSNDIPAVEELVERYALTAKLAGVRALDIPVLELEKDWETTRVVGINLALASVRDDGAGAIILGCTRLASMAPQIEAELTRAGYPAPVLNPSLVALRMAEMLVSLGQVHSRRSYSPPSEKKVRFVETK